MTRRSASTASASAAWRCSVRGPRGLAPRLSRRHRTKSFEVHAGMAPLQSQSQARALTAGFQVTKISEGDECAGQTIEASNAMLLDMLAAVAPRDYDDRRRRQAHGWRRQRPRRVIRAAPRMLSEMKAYQMLRAGRSWTTVQRAPAAAALDGKDTEARNHLALSASPMCLLCISKASAP